MNSRCYLIFVSVFSGSSAAIERFSSYNENLEHECIVTLTFDIKIDSFFRYNCIDFYIFLEPQPQLLRKVAGAKKYN